CSRPLTLLARLSELPGPGIEAAEGACDLRVVLAQNAELIAERLRIGALHGTEAAVHPRSKLGQRAPQPAWVTGPRQATPCATAMQTLPLRLHSMQTLYAGTFGLRPASVAVISSINWCLLMGQPRSSKSTGTCSAMGVEKFSVLMNFGVA